MLKTRVLVAAWDQTNLVERKSWTSERVVDRDRMYSSRTFLLNDNHCQVYGSTPPGQCRIAAGTGDDQIKSVHASEAITTKK
jgi:hypothetical protein